MSRVAFIGTCRVLHPANHLRKELKLPALHTAHRVHSPREVERLVRILATGEVDPKAVHTLSDAAFADLVEGKTDWTVEFLMKLHALWDACKGFVIEVSTLKQSFIEAENGRLYVNHYTARDLERFEEQIQPKIAAGIIAPFRREDVQVETASRAEAIGTMRRIKAMIGPRPIIWACHLKVSSDTAEKARLREVRMRIADVVSEGAKLLGDRFYDPTEVVDELGEKAALEKDGTDFNHFTPPAERILAERYWKMISGDRAF